MALVKIKDKYQVTLPAALREKAGLEVGDLLETEMQEKDYSHSEDHARPRAGTGTQGN